jgi:AraC-like DNA-binding protein
MITATFARRLPPGLTPLAPIHWAWLGFTLSVAASMLPGIVGGVTGSFATVLTVVGAGGCAWLWLFARTLFRAEKPVERWVIYMVAGVITIEAASRLTGHAPAIGALAEIYRVLENTESFICFGALALVYVEVFSGYNQGLPGEERRFRLIFAGVFALMVALTLLWVVNAGAESIGGQLKEPVTIGSAFLGIVGAGLSLQYRKRNPLSPASKPKAAARFAGDEALAAQITETLQSARLFATPELKVADLADMLGEQDYKVTQCITGALGYRNFNHMINAHRVESAKAILADADYSSRPILNVAFDCGFNSLGPFNRAFKAQVGMTPREYRMAALDKQAA